MSERGPLRLAYLSIGRHIHTERWLTWFARNGHDMHLLTVQPGPMPGVTIHEITTTYDGSEIHDDRFGSACGLYTNALVTPERVYLPQFGIPEDEVALAQVRAATDRTVGYAQVWCMSVRQRLAPRRLERPRHRGI